MLVVQTRPHRPQAIKKLEIVRRFLRKKIKIKTNEATVGTPRHVCKSFTQTFEDLTCLLNIKWNITPKLDPTLKPSNYKQLRKMHVFRTKVQMSTPFLRNRSWNFAYKCSACPSRDLTSVFFFFSFPEYIWSYVVRTDTCLKVSKKSAASSTSLGAAHVGRYASFAVFRCIDDK